jgi:hypothetical protein
MENEKKGQGYKFLSYFRRSNSEFMTGAKLKS